MGQDAAIVGTSCKGGDSLFTANYNTSKGGRGAGGAPQQSSPVYGTGGGGGDFVIKQPLSVTAGQTYTITIGAGGAQDTHSTGARAGGDGYMLIEWWE